VFLALLDLLRHTLFTASLHTFAGTLAAGAVLLVAAALFSHLVFGEVERLQHTIVQQSRRMAALEEHSRLARDINDGFLQTMYGVGLGLQTCLQETERLPEETAAQLRQSVEQLDRAMDDMRAYLVRAPGGSVQAVPLRLRVGPSTTSARDLLRAGAVARGEPTAPAVRAH
jgi:signal transduction histidine kinase